MEEDNGLTDLETLVLCAIYRHVGFAVGHKPANIPIEAVHDPLKPLGFSRRDVREALKSLIAKGLVRQYEKRRGKKGTYTLTREGATQASQICAAQWDEIRDRFKRKP